MRLSIIVIKPGSGVDPAKGLNPGQPIKPGLFKGKVRLKIRNGEGRQWSGIHVAVMLSLVLWKEKAQLISSPHKFYLSSLTSSQATKLSLFFFYHLFCAGMNTTCWSPEAQSLLLLPLSLLKLWVWFAPPTRRPRPANEEETGERRASFASSNWSRQKEKKK